MNTAEQASSRPAASNDLPAWFNNSLLAPANLFQFYRLFLALFILLTYFTQSGPVWLGLFHPALFSLAAIVYLGFVLTSLILTWLKTIRPEQNIPLMIFIDIVFITVLMHASGGVPTGLGILLAISVTAGSLLMRGKLALLFASLATVAVMTEQLVTYFEPVFIAPDFVQSAMLGLAFFAIALLSHSLAMHLQASEQLARQTRRDLDSMARLNEHVIGHMQEGVIAVDNQHRVRLINAAARQLLNSEQLDASPPLAKLCPSLAKLLPSPGLPFKPETIDIEIDEEDQPNRALRASLTPLGIADSEGTLIFLEDPSEISRQAQQMKLAAIGRLTASIAHEIRNPLGAISHAGQLLSESSNISSDDRRLTEIITNNSLRMNLLIENVLKLSRRDSARPRQVSIKTWLSELRAKLLPTMQLQPGQIQLAVDPDDAVGLFDPEQIDQALTILVNNALTHFDGEVDQLVINIRYQHQTNGAWFECEDNGPGIETAALKQIFEPFFTTRNAGTGLGLYIARELAESNHASISYQPAQPHGSRFKISFNL